jgi:hypothetical protein
MWPYDYYCANGAIINEFNSDCTDFKIEREVFVVKWYGDTEDEIAREQEKYRNMATIIDKTDITIDDTRYKLKASIAENTKMGSITLDIFKKIMESTFVVIDITPLYYRQWGKKEEEKDALFCANAMLELGLSMAWKMEEQVICLWDKKNPLTDLPFNLKNYSAIEIDFDCLLSGKNNFKKLLENRIEALDFKKNVFIQSIKSKLDGQSIIYFIERKGNLFTDLSADINTLRRLIDLGLIAVELYSNPKGNWTYYLTDLGRFILSKYLKKKLFPKKFTEFARVIYCKGYPSEFEIRKQKYIQTYNINDFDAIDLALKNILKQKRISDLNQDTMGMFNKYAAQHNDLETMLSEIVQPWLRQVDNELTNRVTGG